MNISLQKEIKITSKAFCEKVARWKYSEAPTHKRLKRMLFIIRTKHNMQIWGASFVAWKRGLSLRVFFLTFYLFGSHFRMLAVIFVLDVFFGCCCCFYSEVPLKQTGSPQHSGHCFKQWVGWQVMSLKPVRAMWDFSATTGSYPELAVLWANLQRLEQHSWASSTSWTHLWWCCSNYLAYTAGAAVPGPG